MTIGYRAILRLDDTDDAVDIANEQLRSWFRTKTGRRGLLTTTDWDGPGTHRLGPHARLAVVRTPEEKDGSRRQMARFSETNSSGTWIVAVWSLALPNAKVNRQTLVVEAGLEGATEAEARRVVAPPNIVRQLLERSHVRDGNTQLHPTPTLIGTDQIAQVVEAIEDPDRTASVVVATSLGTEIDAQWTRLMGDLTKPGVGVSTVFVISGNAAVPFQAAMPDSHQVPAGRVRTFAPHTDLASRADGLRHRILGPTTLARSIVKGRIRGRLPDIHAEPSRRRLLERELPPDVRRGMDLLTRSEERLKLQERVSDRLDSSSKVSVADTETRPAASIPATTSPTDAPPSVPQLQTRPNNDARLLHRLGKTIKRWLGHEEPDIGHLDSLDAFVELKTVEAAVATEQLDTLVEERNRLRALNARLATEIDDLQLQAAYESEDAEEQRREATVLRGRLRSEGRWDDAYVEPEDEIWAAPASVSELVARLSPGEDEHPIMQRVVFTGDEDHALEVQKRDPAGRFARNFWTYVRVLHDYAEARARESFAGNVHVYLTDEAAPSGTRCSADRHAARESASVTNNAKWSAERVFPVPPEVSGGGAVAMMAHFKPNHSDTFAPRMHYYDDTENTGLIYVGYIGRHLGNTKTN